MRIIAAATIACLGLAALGGCGQSDDAFRALYRTNAINNCVAGARSSPQAATSGIDIPRLCNCAVDNYLAHAPISELRSQNSSTDLPPSAREATTQCVNEQMRAAGRAPASEAPPGPPPPPGGDTGGK